MMSWNVSHNLQICLPFVSLVYPASIFAPFFTVTLAHSLSLSLILPYSLLYICYKKNHYSKKVRKKNLEKFQKKHAD